jgi:hypothetical protein
MPLMITSHHGGCGILMRSCNHTVGTVPKNNQRSAWGWKCQRVGAPSSVAAPRLRSYTTSTRANGSQSRTTANAFWPRPMLAATSPVAM